MTSNGAPITARIAGMCKTQRQARVQGRLHNFPQGLGEIRRAHREGVIGVSIERRALVNFMLQRERQHKRQVIFVQQPQRIGPEGDVLPLRCRAAAAPRVQERPHARRHHLASAILNRQTVCDADFRGGALTRGDTTWTA